MSAVLNESIKQLIAYLGKVLAQGVDISALYIIEAHLTKIKFSLRPSNLILKLFSNIQIRKIITFSRDYYDKQKSKESSMTSVEKFFEDYNTFKVSLKEFDSNPVSQISIVSEQILQTLEEWTQISNNTQKLKTKLGTVTSYNCCLSSDQSLKQELESLIGIISENTSEKQYKIITDSSSCISSLEDGDTSKMNSSLKIFQITSFFQYILVWSNQIMKEISDFSALVSVVKEQFSVNQYKTQRGNKLTRYRSSIQNRVGTPEENSQKMLTHTQRILSKKQNKDINTMDFDHQFPQVKRIESLTSFSSELPFSKLKANKIESDINMRRVGWNGQRNKENALPLNEKHCQKCLIF